MDRRRKGYLLRKTDFLDHLAYKPQINGNAVCSCNKSSARSYDLQTQTITFDEEPQFERNYIEGNQTILNHPIPMDQDLEFYPVDDHPSPSTFTAWDAFLAGNQAFFREPPGLLPDPAFSYMDVIPEEDDLEALLESDTDDTGSSVSTVIDRFSRTSTANSSFSERCKGTPEVTFDLQKVLSPFERLEKELDADESKDEPLKRKVVPRGPIVVITNSSSCEDVHSAEEEENSKTPEDPVQKINGEQHTDKNCVEQTADDTSITCSNDSKENTNESKQCPTGEKPIESDKCNGTEPKPDTAKIPQVPARSKLLNGSRISEKTRVKSDKSENSLPTSSGKKKKSYPTPSVPPRMSKHLPARRTRSDPGSADQPSRIPRPITNSNRSPVANTSPKSNAKNNRSPKINTNKKLKFTESPKSNRNANKSSVAVAESPAVETKHSPSESKKEKAVVRAPSEDSFVECTQSDTKSVEVANAGDSKETAESEPSHETNNLMETFETVPGDRTKFLVVNESEPKDTSDQNSNHIPPCSDFATVPITTEERSTNPFRKNETNPFKSVAVESKNPFVVCNNPFEESPEVTPALQPKGQMSASLIAPPIPERPSVIAAQKRENVKGKELDTSNNKESISEQTPVEENRIDVPPGSDEEVLIGIQENGNSAEEIFPEKSTTSIDEAIEAALIDMDMIEEKTATTESSLNTSSDQNDQVAEKESSDNDKGSGPQRPIEDILQALDQLVLSAPREVEISIDWGARGPVNIREKTVLPSDASGDRSEISETDGLTEDRRRDIETLLKEVDECLKLHKVSEDSSAQQPIEENLLPASDSLLSTNERTSLSPGSLDAPTAGSTSLNLCQHDEQGTHDSNIVLEQSPSEMLKHQSQSILAGEQRVGYSVPYQEQYSKTTEQLDEESLISKHHSSGCDDSGVFLEDPIASSPETQSRSAANRLQSTLDKFANESSKMRQYSIHEGLDSDAEKSDDLGLASSSIDSADDLDGDPLPSTLQITPSCPPVVTTRQKPPPVPARKSMSKSLDYQKNNRYYSEITTLEVPSHQKAPLSKSSSSGEDSNFGEGDHCLIENSSTTFSVNEKSKNIINQHKNEQSRSNFAMTRSFHEDMLLNQQRDNSHDSKTNFLARTLSTSVKKLDVTNGNSSYNRRNSEQPSSFKWKSEECLRTAAENKWSLPGRRYEKSVSVKDRIAMFSEMEASQVNCKRDDLQRYGSENNIKAMTGIIENKKAELPVTENNKSSNLLKDSKWHSMHSITKKPVEKETSYNSTNMKPALSIPSLTANNLIDNFSSNNGYATLPVKLEVESPKPIVSSYPETQLTNNKRYNYGLYSLQNLKNTENLLSKKAAGSNLLSIIDNRKQSSQKLKGLVIPDKPYQANNSKELPTIVSSDSDGLKETRRGSLPITPVTAAKAMSLPRNKKLECVPAQRQTSLSEPPWKNESNSSYTLPKYSPAFKKRSLELPGSSLSPTPPSSITSPMSPPPSSPSSICSSNASSTLQQNVFQFSLSHSKPVQPLQPEKALMSPPSMPSDVEYEGDNSEDSSHSASPMRVSSRNNKEVKSATQHQNPGIVQFGKSNAFTTSAKGIPHQPMMVETLAKSALPCETEPPKPKAAVYLSKTEILLKKDEAKSDLLSRDQDVLSNEFISSICKSNDQIAPVQEIPTYKLNGSVKCETYPQTKIDVSEVEVYDKKNGDFEYNDYYSNKISSNNGLVRNGGLTNIQSYGVSDTSVADIPVGKFRAFPVSLKESEAKSTVSNSHNLETKHKNHESSSWGNGRPPQSECEESEDDDTHSTLSHRTEDSRHTTTDDCLSDATTDSFEKPRLVPEQSHMQRPNDDNASTEGYLSDASTDVSIRRFTNRPIDSNAYSTEEYLSDATAESPDPDWISNRGCMDQNIYIRSKSYRKPENINQSSFPVQDGEVAENPDKNADPDLRPRRLSQQRTVLKAAVEPSGSVQKFKALAEKWEQRSDVISPPPPVVAPLPPKKESKAHSIATGIISSSTVTNALIKGKSTLPPSLMPRNSSEKKMSQSTKSSCKESVFVARFTDKETSSDGILTRKSVSSTSTVIETNNGWNPHHYDELNRLESSPRRDSTSSTSSSSKTTLKDDEAFESPPPLSLETNGFDSAKYDAVVPQTTATSENNAVSQNSQRPNEMNLPSRQDDIFNNEPRNRRGMDFSRTNSIPDWPKSNRPAFGAKSTFSVSDIRRSFENGSKENEKPTPLKKPPVPVARLNAPAAVQPLPVPARRPSMPIEDVECADELRLGAESARNQLKNEGVSSQFDVLTVVLRREGEGGGSVGITLAGGADYEVKEITVHKVISGSIADRDGRVLKGDRVMSINGRDLRGVSHGEALHILKAPSPKVRLVLARDKNGSPLQHNGTMERETKRRPDYGNNKDSETIVVQLLKDAAGLGFSIEGGRDSPQGDRPLLIKRIFKGGAADKDGQLEEGDEIMSVNDQPVTNMTRTEAWNFLKKLPEGPVLLKARKISVVA